MTTTADVSDCTVTLDILSQTNHFIFIDKRTFLADKGYDVKAVYNTVKELYHGECVIPLNKRNTKNPKSSQADIPFVKQVLLWWKMVNLMTITEPDRNTAAHWNSLKTKVVHAITNAGIMARKIEDTPNILLFPMITYRLSIDRDWISFKKIYALRTEVKRYNARFKQTGQECMWVHGFNVV